MNKIAKKEHDNLLPADPMISMIERVAIDPDADLEKLERMLAMKKEHDAEVAKAAFSAAFARASADFPTIPLNGMGHQNKAYATLKDITRLTRPVLSENGLALTFSIDTKDKVTVTAELMHKSGHSKSTSIILPADASGSKNAVQAIGSSQTYGQRYTAQAILGLSLGDDTEDDGLSTGEATKPEAKKQYSWAGTVIQDLPESATARDKAEAVATALCSQFKRMKGERQISNEWDRRAKIISGLEESYKDLWESVIDAYEIKLMQIKEGAR